MTNEIKTANAEVLKHLTSLPELKNDWSDEKQMKTIDKVYQEISNSKHPVAIAMARQKIVKEVGLLRGRRNEISLRRPGSGCKDGQVLREGEKCTCVKKQNI